MTSANAEGNKVRVFSHRDPMVLVNGDPIDPSRTYPGHQDPYDAMVEGAHADPDPNRAVRQAEILHLPVRGAKAPVTRIQDGFRDVTDINSMRKE